MTFSHIDDTGAARMVDVGEKAIVRRTAVAEGEVRMAPETVTLYITDMARERDLKASTIQRRLASNSAWHKRAGAARRGGGGPGQRPARVAKALGLRAHAQGVPARFELGAALAIGVAQVAAWVDVEREVAALPGGQRLFVEVL